MRDLAPTLRSWLAEGRGFALATVVQTWGSSPRQAGAGMAIDTQGSIVGSVSAGCVEGVVIESAQRVATTGQPEFLHFDSISNETAWEVGLSCGGEIEVWVEPTPPELGAMLDAIEAGRPCGRRVERAPYRTSILAEDELPAQTTFGGDVFTHVVSRQPELIVIGAGHMAIPLVHMAQLVGYHVTVIDPRAACAQPERFPVQPDALCCAWPDQALSGRLLHEDVYAVCLSHDPKIDEPALRLLLPSAVAYVGALGSRTTQAQRRQNLLDAGLSPAAVERLKGPVGLSIGAKSPEEIAVSILAEMIQVRHAAR